jgi:hypothetical protein
MNIDFVTSIDSAQARDLAGRFHGLKAKTCAEHRRSMRVYPCKSVSYY